MSKRHFIILLLFISSFLPLSVKAFTYETSSAADLKDIFKYGYVTTGDHAGETIDEVKLTDNTNISLSVYINYDLIIDLNGYTLDNAGKTLFPKGGKTVTIKDTSSSKTGKVTSTSYVFQPYADSNLIVNSGSIESSGTAAINNNGNTTINGGLVKGSGRFAINNKDTGTLTINGGTIEDTGTGVYDAALQNSNILVINGGTIKSNVIGILNYGDIEMNDGTIDAGESYGVYLSTDATMVLNNGTIKTNTIEDDAVHLSQPGAKFTMNDGKIEALNGSGDNGGAGVVLFEDTEAIINGGTIHSYSNAIQGNGSFHGESNAGENAKVTITNGTITSDTGAGLYIPQVNGLTTISGGTITGKTGVEIRAGKLVVSGGTIKGDKDNYSMTAYYNGLTTYGAAISVAQHTTNQPIEVIITGGDFNSNMPISYNNLTEKTADKISIDVQNGDFNSTGDAMVNIPDLPVLTGGEYNESVASNVKQGYGEVEINGKYYVTKKHNITVDPDSANYVVGSLSAEAAYKETVRLKLVSKEDYKTILQIKDESGKITEIEDDKFTMPDCDVTISVKYIFIYKIISGENQVFDNKDIVIKSNGDISKLKEIRVNNKVLDEENYETKSGSTILTLKTSYLKTLKEGTYSVKFVYNDGEAETTFIIEKQKEETTPPKTKDNILFYLLAFTISLVDFSLLKIYKKGTQE